MRRPDFHFTPEKGWMNDPNGMVYDGEFYHLFYQSCPESITHDALHICWGHARSRDLMNWEYLPLGVEWDELGGIFSGSAVMDGKDMVLMFTYHNKEGVESQAIARSKDGSYETFIKHPQNPVIPNPGLKDFRDPKIFLKDDEGCWHVALASTDRVLFYTSPDLIHWTHAGSFGSPDYPVPGLWECPDMVKLTAPDGKEKWVLIFSLGLDAVQGGGKTMYFIGDYKDGAFTPDSSIPQPVDKGQNFYAGVTFSGAPDDRKIMMAWMSNWGNAHKFPGEDWRGQMSCARELFLVETWEGLRLGNCPLVDAEKLECVSGQDMYKILIVRDRYSIETFIPDQGVSFTQTVY